MLKQFIKAAPRLLIITALSIALLACGGDGSGGTGVASGDIQASLSGKEKTLELSGTVGDAPVVAARIIIKDAKGEEVASTISSDRAHYNVTIPKGTTYPLTITVSGGINTVTNAAPYFEMTSVVEHAYQEIANINSFTTLITKSAQAMDGGVNLSNVSLAKLQIINSVGFGLNGETIPDVITTKVTEENVASLVKASAAMGEWLRRAHTTLFAEDESWSQENLLTTLSTDLTDGVLDGRQGEKAADAVVAATATVLSAQVLIETLSQTLKVAGVDAMASI